MHCRSYSRIIKPPHLKTVIFEARKRFFFEINDPSLCVFDSCGPFRNVSLGCSSADAQFCVFNGWRPCGDNGRRRRSPTPWCSPGWLPEPVSGLCSRCCPLCRPTDWGASVHTHSHAPRFCYQSV